MIKLNCNKCSDGNMEVKLPVYLENFDRLTDQQTDMMGLTSNQEQIVEFSIYNVLHCNENISKMIKIFFLPFINSIIIFFGAMHYLYFYNN